MKKLNSFVIFFVALLVIVIFQLNLVNVNADELSDNIQNQLDNLDLSSLEEYFNSLQFSYGGGFVEALKSILKGEYNFNFETVFEYVFAIFLENYNILIPSLSAIVIIAFLCSVISNLKGKYMSKGLGDIIFFVFFISTILILGSQVVGVYKKTKNLLETLANFNEIMSPILLTLMVSSGGNVSALLYKPAVALLSGGIINVIVNLVLPIIAFSSLLIIFSNFSDTIKLNKLGDSGYSIAKWILGLIATIFTIFLTIQGVSSAIYDGVSIRATKYAISNSIPIIGSLLKDGFDLVVAGSILIKNAIGLISVFGIFYTILSPVIFIWTFSFLLKLVGGITESFGDKRISDTCTALSKTITYLNVCILLVGLMIFITILLIIFSANAFI